ncbi:MAG: MarR family transcriptional regulator [Melioribacteraceae bacterium]|nr:MarR family transcriptional regulator [Melioribacteraceae bacterium]
MNNLAAEMADLTCKLARTCNEKENYFASMFNLTPAEFKCLKLFEDTQSLSIKEIAGAMNLTPGRITHILTSLENKNFVERKIDMTDKRNIIVHLTNKSGPFIKNLNESHIKIHKEILENIDEDKREYVIGALGDIYAALKTWGENKF